MPFFVFHFFLHLLPSLAAAFLSFSPSSSHIYVTFFILLYYSHLLSAHCHCTHTGYVKTSISTEEHSTQSCQHRTVWVCSMSTQIFIFILCIKKKKLLLYFTHRCPIKYGPTNKSLKKWTVVVKTSPACCYSCNYAARCHVLTSHKPSHPRLYFSKQPSRITFHHLSGTYKNSHRRRCRYTPALSFLFIYFCFSPSLTALLSV